jgi:hypothetical protein
VVNGYSQQRLVDEFDAGSLTHAAYHGSANRDNKKRLAI